MVRQFLFTLVVNLHGREPISALWWLSYALWSFYLFSSVILFRAACWKRPIHESEVVRCPSLSNIWVTCVLCAQTVEMLKYQACFSFPERLIVRDDVSATPAKMVLLSNIYSRQPHEKTFIRRLYWIHTSHYWIGRRISVSDLIKYQRKCSLTSVFFWKSYYVSGFFYFPLCLRDVINKFIHFTMWLYNPFQN